MAVFDHLNKTTSSGVSSGVTQYYERLLLENMRPELVHSRDAQKRFLPAHNGKRVQFRRFTPFAAITTPLSEGVTPAGQELRQTAFTALVKPYGGHAEITDELDFFQLDNMHRETAQLLSDQAALSVDTLARNAINAGLNVQYVGGKTGRGMLTATDTLTSAELKKAVRTLKRNNCKPFDDGFYHAIVHPDAVHDLTADTMWVDVAKYQDKTRVERYELGCMYKVKFYESANAMVFKPQSYLIGTVSGYSASAAWDRAKLCMTCSAAAIAEGEARELTGMPVSVQYTKNSVTVTTPMCIERVDAAEKKFYFRWQPAASVTDEWTVANTCQILPTGGGASGCDVFSTLVYGKNAFGDIELGGANSGGRNIEIIINPPGSAGASDPLKQRGTVAWKVNGFCSVILQDDFIVRIESGASD